jgi:uncharacterized protein with PQ loop repeat
MENQTTIIIGYIASFITIIYTAIGMPNQIVKNYKIKCVKSLSLFLFITLFLTFSSWVVYGMVKPDWFIGIPNALGAICAFIITCQIIYYKK